MRIGRLRVVLCLSLLLALSAFSWPESDDGLQRAWPGPAWPSPDLGQAEITFNRTECWGLKNNSLATSTDRTCWQSIQATDFPGVPGSCRSVASGDCPGWCSVPTNGSIRFRWFSVMNLETLSNATESECKYDLVTVSEDGTNFVVPIPNTEIFITYDPSRDNNAGVDCTKGWINPGGTYLNPGPNPGLMRELASTCARNVTGSVDWPRNWYVRVTDWDGSVSVQDCPRVKGVMLCVNFDEIRYP